MTYYISPRFLDKLAVHITKNYLELSAVKVPLILGIHGRKGEGKSFQCDLVFQRMGIEAVYMSAGELESPDAGDPARLIRLRYREAAESVRVRGRMAVLLINDIDAGMGRVDSFTQYTVNTQLVAGTLMNIADNPTNVQLPGSYDSELIQRVPILVTGNDFSTLYAPLIRDGRMEKFYWQPDRDDRLGIVAGIFQMDGVKTSDIERLVDAFPDQAIDFFSALHSRLYDEQVRQLIQAVGIERISSRVVNSAEAPPEFRPPNFSLSHLLEMGKSMVQEQQRIQELRLSRTYHALSDQKWSDGPNQSDGSNPSGAPNRADAMRSPVALPGVAPPGNANAPITPGSGSANGSRSSIPLPPEAQSFVTEALTQGDRVGIEYVDERRFRTNAWHCYAVVSSVGEALQHLQACLAEHSQDYVRLVRIQASDRQRRGEAIVQRPRAAERN